MMLFIGIDQQHIKVYTQAHVLYLGKSQGFKREVHTLILICFADS